MIVEAEASTMNIANVSHHPVFKWAVALWFALLLGGGLTALQTAVITTGLPFTLVLLVACYAIVKGLLSEPRS